MADTSRRGLGRGLAALLGDADPPRPATSEGAPASPEGSAREAPVELLRRNPEQPRRQFDDTEIEELAQSIREKGVLQPILVRPAPGAPGEWQIVAGERRWRAAQLAGLHVVPILVRELSDSDVLEIGIVENVQRADLNPIEEAAGYRALMDRFGRTQADVAQVVGKSRSHVANALRLLELPEGVREHVTAGRLSSGHARAIAAAPEPARLAQAIVARGLSVRQAEALARAANDRPAPPPRVAPPPAPPPPAPSASGPRDPDILALEHDISAVLGLRCEIDDHEGSGQIRISYRTLEQLDDVLRRLSL